VAGQEAVEWQDECGWFVPRSFADIRAVAMFPDLWLAREYGPHVELGAGGRWNHKEAPTDTLRLAASFQYYLDMVNVRPPPSVTCYI